MGIATIIERLYGTAFAATHIYHAWWFVALWAMLAACSLVMLFRKRLHPAVLLLHISFVGILAGAYVTYLTAQRGTIHLRLDAPERAFVDSESHKLTPLPFTLILSDFQIINYPGTDTPMDYVSTISLPEDGSKEVISMNNIARRSGYRIFQTSYDDDLQGSIFIVSYDPWGTGITYIGYCLCVISMLWMSLKRRSFWRKANGWKEYVGWTLGIVFALYMVVPLLYRPLMPVLRHPMLFVHVGAMIVSYCLLIVSAFNRSALRPAVFTLAAGIFLGSMWANISWGRYWGWDPKETWALITLMIYAVPLHKSFFPYSDRIYHIYILLSFLAVLMTYFGVNYLLPGMHSYA